MVFDVGSTKAKYLLLITPLNNYIVDKQMHNSSPIKSSVNLSQPARSHYYKYATSTDLRPQVDDNPRRLLSVLNAIICGQKNLSLSNNSPNVAPKIKRQTSIQNLQILISEPMPDTRTSTSAFSQHFSAFNLECDSSKFSSFSLEPQVNLSDFNCNCLLDEEDIHSIFGNGDYKVMISAVALMCKFFQLNSHRPTLNNIFMVFCTSAIITFKLTYDENLPELFKQFSSRLGINVGKLEKLESIFLRAVNYDINIHGKAFNQVMTWFI